MVEKTTFLLTLSEFFSVSFVHLKCCFSYNPVWDRRKEKTKKGFSRFIDKENLKSFLGFITHDE